MGNVSEAPLRTRSRGRGAVGTPARFLASRARGRGTDTRTCPPRLAPIVSSQLEFFTPRARGSWTRAVLTEPFHSLCFTLFASTPMPEVGREHGESLTRGRDSQCPLTRVPRHAILFLIAPSGLRCAPVRSPLARGLTTSGDGGRVPCASARHASRL